MKYWRGYLVAAIIAACTWGLETFAETHSALVDMVYPYATRMVQTYLAGWSGTVDFLVWQVLLIAFAVLVLASVVLMVVLKWNPIQWFGWVLAVASVAVLLNTGIYGLNHYAGPISDDIRLEEADYTLSELESAAKYYRNQANKLAAQVAAKSSAQPTLAELNEQAAEGFEVMKTEQFQSIFAGSTLPVKELGFANYFTKQGVDSVHIGATGEAAVNMELPAPAQPFVICQLMAKRMCIAKEADSAFAAFLASRSNSSPEFQYAAYLMAYRACCATLEAADQATGGNVANQVRSGAESKLALDDAALDSFYKEQDPKVTEEMSKLLVSLYIQEEVLPLLKEEEVLFDPLDETQVDLSGIVNAGK